jgi:uncharacterized repeat protein (TIGR01451 family)
MKKLAAVLTLSLLSAAVALPSFAGGEAARKKPAAPIDERALKGTGPQGTPVLSPEDTVMYSGDTTGEAQWDRPFADCTGESQLGPVVFEVQPFHVSANGAYDLTSVQTGWDGFIFVYINSFDPNNANTNCVAGNDDGGGGIGTSEIFGLALTAGTQYLLVTTAFEAGEDGPFTNTIDGPGTITLGSLGGNVDLSVTKTGEVPVTGPFSYTIDAANAGPDAATSVVVADTLPAGMTYVSDTCGGSAVGQNWTWNIGGLAASASASCTLNVTIATVGCSPFTNTATISSTNFDTNSANNSSTASNATEAVQDGDFEDGSPSTFWIEQSTNFGTPLCTIAGCGQGTGTGPHSGDWWAWFGGIAAPEVGSMTQNDIVIPENSVLSFWFEAPVCANTTDFVRIQIDGTTVWEATGAHPECNSVGYVNITADISAFADGGIHDLVITSTISGVPSGTNFFIDDVSIAAATCGGGGGGPGAFETTFDVAVPTLSEIGLAAMALLMAASAFLVLRKR